MRAYDRYKIDPARALLTAKISPALLKEPDAKITAAQMEMFSGLAMREMDDEALGWFSRPLRFGANGMLCWASLPLPDLRIALMRWFGHNAIRVDDIRMELTVKGEEASISINEKLALGKQREF